MTDPVAAAVAALASDVPTTTLAGEHLYGGELPHAVAAGMPRRAILVVPSGGISLTAGSRAEVDSQRIDLFAFGATPLEANELCQVAARRLWLIEREVFAGTLIHWINRAGGFSQARDRDGQWPQCFRSFQVFYSTQAAA